MFYSCQLTNSHHKKLNNLLFIYSIFHVWLSSPFSYNLLSAVSLIFTRVSFRAPTDAPNCESLFGFPKTNRSSSPSSYSVSSTSDKIHGFSASPRANSKMGMTGNVKNNSGGCSDRISSQIVFLHFFYSIFQPIYITWSHVTLVQLLLSFGSCCTYCVKGNAEDDSTTGNVWKIDKLASSCDICKALLI